MEKLSVQAFNALFTQFNQLDSTVLWLLSKDSNKQIYVSEAFEAIWGRATNVLYDNPKNWNDFLAPVEKEKAIQQVHSRFINPEEVEDNVALFKIIDASGEVKLIKDSAFVLTDEHDNHVGFVGLGQLITPQQWETEVLQKTLKKNDPQQQLKKYLFNILRKEFNVNVTVPKKEIPNPSDNSQSAAQCVVMHQGEQLLLTAREAECLVHLAAGMSAKQTATRLNISTRTVEFHLNNIKMKANCRTKLELLAKTVVK